MCCPQLQERRRYRWSQANGLKIDSGDGLQDSTNPYLEATLSKVLLFASQVHQGLPDGINIAVEIKGSNSFYSHRDTLEGRGSRVCMQELAQLAEFAPLQIQSDQITGSNTAHRASLPKTGLGSSAALVASLVAALLHHFECIDLNDGTSRSTVHNIAQLCHCGAQGKIGSGFDIAAAVHGSQSYVRFSPSLLADALQPSATVGAVFQACGASPSEVASPIRATLEQKIQEFGCTVWDSSSATICIPNGLCMLLGDVSCGGSSTPSMVSAVLKWRKSVASEESEWDQLAALNMDIQRTLGALSARSESEPGEWDRCLGALCQGTAQVLDLAKSSETSQCASMLLTVQEQFGIARALLRRVGERAGVPIEPQQQQTLLDATARLPGVLCAGVPGAGGYDAVFCLVAQAMQPAVVELWEEWKETDVVPLPVHVDGGGVRLENIS